MYHTISRIAVTAPMIASALLALPAAALADVQAGVDAWARGDYPAAIQEWDAAAAQDETVSAQMDLIIPLYEPEQSQELTQKPQVSGPWRVQLGAFGARANADALWNRLKDRPEFAGRERIDVGTGRVRRLLAGGFATEAEAKAACTQLAASGRGCFIVGN